MKYPSRRAQRLLALALFFVSGFSAAWADICKCGSVCPCRPTCPCPKLNAPSSPVPKPTSPPSRPAPTPPSASTPKTPSTSIGEAHAASALTSPTNPPSSPSGYGDNRRRPPEDAHLEPPGPHGPDFVNDGPGSEVPEVPDVVIVPGGALHPHASGEDPLKKYEVPATSTTTTATESGSHPDYGYKLDSGLKLSANWNWKDELKINYGPPLTPAVAPPPYNGPRQIMVVDGWFEPSQGVWQDDKRFADAPGRRLRKTAPAIRQAELEMVKDRPTLIFGIRDDNYSDCVLQYATQMKTPVSVHFRFTLKQGGKSQVIYEEDPGLHTIYYDPPETGKWEQMEVRATAVFGFPRQGKGPGGSDSFTFSSAGPYIIEAELFRDDSNTPTGIKAMVFGHVVETFAPKAQIMPAMLWPHSDPALHESDAQRLVAASQTMAAACELLVPEWYPIKPGSFSLPVRRVRDLGSYVQDYLADPGKAKWRSSLGPDADLIQPNESYIPAILGEYFDILSRLGEMSRTVVVVSTGDFLQQNLFVNQDDLKSAKNTLAYAASQKVIFAPSDSTADTIAHELVHTLPYLWSKYQMLSLFGFTWHNKEMNVANGPQIFKSRPGGGFVIDRRRHDNGRCLMESGDAGAEYWSSQGTYWHLLHVLQQPPDPELILVSGLIAEKNGRRAGTIHRVYSLTGAADLQPASASAATSGGWSIDAVDLNGKLLARYPFSPQWTDSESEGKRVTIPFSYTIPNDDRISEIRLVGPDGQLDARKLSFAPPELTLLSPQNGASVRLDAHGAMPVSWKSSASGGLPLKFSVFYSPDGGAHWFDQVLEQNESTFSLHPEGGTANPLVRVIAWDGTRSRTVTVGFSVAP